MEKKINTTIGRLEELEEEEWDGENFLLKRMRNIRSGWTKTLGYPGTWLANT
ncbi:hypothetical protein LC724_24370 [Blautia sp. RD014234]|nr:hypothetical protein [Blautia parvula]